MTRVPLIFIIILSFAFGILNAKDRITISPESSGLCEPLELRLTGSNTFFAPCTACCRTFSCVALSNYSYDTYVELPLVTCVGKTVALRYAGYQGQPGFKYYMSSSDFAGATVTSSPDTYSCVCAIDTINTGPSCYAHWIEIDGLTWSTPGTKILRLTYKLEENWQVPPVFCDFYLSIQVLPGPNVNLGADTTLLFGDSTLLQGPIGHSSYQWNVANVGNNYTVTSPGTYSLTVTASNGCRGSDQIAVNYASNCSFNVDLGIDTVLCAGTSHQLDPGLGLSNVYWNTGDISSILTVNQTGTYSVFAVDTNGCAGYDTIQVALIPPSSLGADTTICTGDTALLQLGQGYSSYLWSDGSIDSTLAVTSAGIYWVQTVDNDGCAGHDTIQVTVNFPGSLGTDTMICTGDTALLQLGQGYSSYLWSDGSIDSALAATSAGAYWVQTVDTNGCAGYDTIQVALIPPSSLGADTTICTGDTALLQLGRGYASYLWSDGSIDSAMAVTTAGTYWVQTVDNDGCGNRDSILVTDTTFQSSFVITDSIFDCDSVLLSVIPPSFSAYQWSSGGQAQTERASIPNTFLLEVRDGNGCKGQDSVVVTPQHVPMTIQASTLSLCLNDSLMLDAYNPLYLSYTWSNGDTLPTTIVNSPGNYIASGYTAQGCVEKDTVEVNYYPIPGPNPQIYPAGPHSICPGDSIQLSSDQGYSSYMWSNGANTQTTQVNQAGSYTVTVTNGFNCLGTSAPMLIQYFLITAPSISVSGDTLYSSPGLSYAWYLNGMAIPSASGTSYTVLDSGYYQVAVVDQNGCESFSDSLFMLPASLTSIKPVNGKGPGILIYPNPSNGKVRVRFTEPVIARFRVYSLSGKRVFELPNATEEEINYLLSLDGIPKGLYLIWCETEKAQFSAKVRLK